MTIPLKTVQASSRYNARYNGRRATRTVQVRISGRWLEDLNFKPNEPVYIGKNEQGQLILSPTPLQPKSIMIGGLEDLQARYKELGIPVTREMKVYA